jgi:2-C-methyl-D-erythritol 4-phosphate cytidylyltransferase
MGGVDKIMAPLAGEPVILHTLRAFQAAPDIWEIVLVTRRELRDTLEALVRDQDLTKVTAVVPGGQTRVESVQNGLLALNKHTDLVAVQDGARPLVTQQVIGEAVGKAKTCHAAAPAIPLKDTVKKVDPTGRVVETPDRDTLRAVQTPQVFDRDLLLAAWEKARQEGQTYTDDCGAMEALGVPVYLTQGDEENLKLTTPLDLLLAEEILKRRKQP